MRIKVYKGETIREEDEHQILDILIPVLENAGFTCSPHQVGMVARRPRTTEGPDLELWLERERF